MITASIVLYKTKTNEIEKVLSCADKSCIEEIYVIDNSPNDNLRRLICSLSQKVEYIYGQGNVGYGHAHNIGIGKAK